MSDKMIQPSTAKVYVFSDSVLCPGKMKQHSGEKKKIDCFTSVPQYRELDRVDGEAMEFAWKFFSRFTKNDARNDRDQTSTSCKHYTKPTHTSDSLTHDFRDSRLESLNQQESLCLTNNRARVFVVDSFTLQHCFTFHMTPVRLST